MSRFDVAGNVSLLFKIMPTGSDYPATAVASVLIYSVAADLVVTVCLFFFQFPVAFQGSFICHDSNVVEDFSLRQSDLLLQNRD